MNLNQVTLAAIDLDASVKFYQLLGLTLIVDTPHYARFECPNGDSTFSLHKAEPPMAEPSFLIYFECENLDQTVTEIQEKGISFSKEPTDESWLWREARLSDPSGNPICLFWGAENRKNPPWRVNSQ